MIRGIAFLTLIGTMILSSCAKKESPESHPAERGSGQTYCRGPSDGTICRAARVRSFEEWKQCAGHDRCKFTDGHGGVRRRWYRT